MQGSHLSTKQSKPLTTVLLVEDDKSVKVVLERWLAECGLSVVACSTFHEAKAYLALNTPDLLITDIRLQDYNGLQLVMQMAEKHTRASSMVITGHDDPVLRKEAERLHAQYLTKPFAKGDFLTAVDHVATADDGRMARVPTPVSVHAGSGAVKQTTH